MKIPSNNNFSVKRLLIVIFVVISVLCIIFFAAISRFNTPLFHAVVINILAPFQSVTSAVSSKISAFGDYVGDGLFYICRHDRAGEYLRDGSLARAASACEEIGVSDVARLYLVDERPHDMILTYDVSEGVGTISAIERSVSHMIDYIRTKFILQGNFEAEEELRQRAAPARRTAADPSPKTRKKHIFRQNNTFRVPSAGKRAGSPTPFP